jgi:hypothetical protein
MKSCSESSVATVSSTHRRPSNPPACPPACSPTSAGTCCGACQHAQAAWNADWFVLPLRWPVRFGSLSHSGGHRCCLTSGTREAVAAAATCSSAEPAALVVGHYRRGSHAPMKPRTKSRRVRPCATWRVWHIGVSGPTQVGRDPEPLRAVCRRVRHAQAADAAGAEIARSCVRSIMSPGAPPFVSL